MCLARRVQKEKKGNFPYQPIQLRRTCTILVECYALMASGRGKAGDVCA